MEGDLTQVEAAISLATNDRQLGLGPLRGMRFLCVAYGQGCPWRCKSCLDHSFHPVPSL